MRNWFPIWLVVPRLPAGFSLNLKYHSDKFSIENFENQLGIGGRMAGCLRDERITASWAASAAAKLVIRWNFELRF